MTWKVQDAKQKFSEFVRKAVQEGPQVLSHRGEEVAVLVSLETYQKLSGSGEDFKAFLLTAPEVDLEIERSGEPARTPKL